MMPAPVPAHGIGVGVSREQYTEYLREKKRRLDALCDAAKAYLSVEMDQEIEELSKPVEVPDMKSFDQYMYGPKPTVEDLARASEVVQNLEMQMEKLGELGDGPAAEYLRPLIDAMYLPMLQHQLDNVREHRDRIQKRMEEQAVKEDQPECQ